MAFLMRLAFILQISLVFVIASDDPCHNDGKYECPKYTVTEKGNGYELRKYKKTHWAVAQSGSSGYRSSSSLFRRLFKYIQGEILFLYIQGNTKFRLHLPLGLK